MRLVASLALAARARRSAGLSGLADEMSDLKTQLEAARADLALWSDRLDTAYRRWNVDRYGGQSPDQFNAIIGRYSSNVAAAQNAIAVLEGKVANLSATQVQEKAIEEANKPAPAPSAAQAAQASRDYVAQQLSLVELARGSTYDFGRGGHDRTAWYRASGLGGNMQRILDLDRPSLGFDIFAAVKEGVQTGVRKYREQAPAGALPSIKVDNPFTDLLPDWLAKARLPQPVRVVGGSVVSSVMKAAKAAPANPSAVAQTTVAAPELEDDGPSPLLMGGAALLLGYGIYKATR